MINPRDKWTTARVLNVQNDIDQHIAKLPTALEKEQYICQNLEAYQADPDQDGGYIKLFCFALALMRRSIFSPTLSATKIRGLADLAIGVLRLHQIAPETSRLGFLYSQVYMNLAKFYQRQGQPAESLHHLSLARRAAAKSAPEAKPDFAFEMGNYYYHNGYLLQAIDSYHESMQAVLKRFDAGDLAYVASQRFAIEFPLKRIVTALRHLGEYTLAEEITTGIKAYSELYSRRFLLELNWEQLWRKAQQESNYNGMYYQVKKGKSHYQGKFLIDCLFLRVDESRLESWNFGQIAKPSTLFRNKSLMKKANSKSHKSLILIENLGDSSRPFDNKLDMAVKCYNLIGEMLTPDHKILTLRILHRWAGYHNLTELEHLIARDMEIWQQNVFREVNELKKPSGALLGQKSSEHHSVGQLTKEPGSKEKPSQILEELRDTLPFVHKKAS